MILIGIDIETTGGTHEICEFAAVAVDAETGKEIFAIVSLIDPGPVAWNPYAMRVHGISPSMVRGKPGIREVWNTFKSKFTPYAAAARHFAHNASFERTHLTNGLGRQFTISLECTIALAKTRMQTASYKLPDVCLALGIPFRETHRAEADARAAALVAAKLLVGGTGLRLQAPDATRASIPATRHAVSIADLNSQRGINSQILATTPRVGSFLAGKRVCITGSFPNGMTKEEAKRLVAAHGGIPVDNVTSATDLVVLAASGERITGVDISTEKARKAQALGLEVMAGPDFLRKAVR